MLISSSYFSLPKYIYLHNFLQMYLSSSHFLFMFVSFIYIFSKLSSYFSSSIYIFPSHSLLSFSSCFTISLPFRSSHIFLEDIFLLHSSLAFTYALFSFRHFAILVHPSLPISSRFLFLFFIDNHASFTVLFTLCPSTRTPFLF